MNDAGEVIDIPRGGTYVLSNRPEANRRILLTGQIGVGKSSELWHYFEEKRKETHPGFWVFCSIRSGAPMSR